MQLNSSPTRRIPHGHQFLATWYDPWPEHYGIGTGSLLPWFARGQATKEGRVKAQDPVTGKNREIPVLPVLAPEQVYPEARGAATPLLDFVEHLYQEWITGGEGEGPSPTRTYGLVRWWGFFAYTTASLEQFLRDKRKESRRAHVPTWMPWDAVVPLGDLRSHNQRWLEDWLRQNAHTYTTTVAAFSKVKRGRGEHASDEDFWKHFERASVENIAYVDELPDWFADDDPIHSIYQADPAEWERFARWIASVTGQRLGRARRAARGEAKAYATLDIESRRDAARDLLEQLFDNRQHLGAARRALTGAPPHGEIGADYSGMEKGTLSRAIDALVKYQEHISAGLVELGIDPEQLGGEKAQIKRRIEEIVMRAMPDAGETDPNIFVKSDLFDPEFFNIDYKLHTIVHSEEYQDLFRQRFDGRDSELVMRRAARAMWEYAKRHGKDTATPDKKGGFYGSLYGVMLAYVAWIVPSGEQMEREMLSSGRVSVQGPAGRREWLRRQALAMKELKYGEPDVGVHLSEAARVSALQAALADRGIHLSHEETEHTLALYDAEQLQGALVTPEDVEEALLAEQRVQMLMADKDLSKGEAEEALERFDLLEPSTSAWKPDRFAEVAAELGEEGSMHIATPGRGGEEEEEPEATPEPVRYIVRGGKDVPEEERVVVVTRRPYKHNARFEQLRGEVPRRWYRVHMQPGNPGLIPNGGGEMWVSDGALRHKDRLLANARAVMPSPFRMIAAMMLPTLESK